MRAVLILVTALGTLAGCGDNAPSGAGANETPAHPTADVVPAPAALAGAHVPTLDPTGIVDAEIARVLPPGRRCVFSYTDGGKPVLATSATAADIFGVVKLNGHLVPLRAASGAPQRETVLAAEPVRLTVMPLPDEGRDMVAGAFKREADLRFEIGRSLIVHYRGFYTCGSAADLRESGSS